MSEAPRAQDATGGREDNDAKTAAIIVAARGVFLEKGFDGASMDAIALAANVSKRTVYNRFRSKEDLFGATIEETCRRVLPLDLTDVDILGPKDFVAGLAKAFLEAILAPEALALRRIATFEATRKPELGRSYLENGLYLMLDRGHEILTRLAEHGLVKADDPRRAICQLGGLITEPLYTEVLLGAAPPDLDAAIDEQLSTGLSAFWRLYGVRQA